MESEYWKQLPKHLLNFDNMISTKILIIIYYLGLLGIVLGAVAGVVAGFGLIYFVLSLVIGVLFWRIFCEMLMRQSFRIHSFSRIN